MKNNNNQNLVSVIVPVYNILDCLERCVDSLLAQTYKEIEILLVDDGSTENPPAHPKQGCCGWPPGLSDTAPVR